MILVIEWLKANWRYPTCIAIGLFIGIYLGHAQKPEESIHVEAKQAQSGSIASFAKMTIKPMPMIPSSVPNCPPIPQCPEVSVDCGGSASGSQNQALSATAGTLSAHTSVSVSIGLSSSIQGPYKVGAGALLQYGKISALGMYDFQGGWTIGGFYQVLAF